MIVSVFPLLKRGVAALGSVLILGGTALAPEPIAQPAPSPYSEPKLLATLEADFIDEASGIAESRSNPGLIWLHNDSGDGAYLYGVDRQGKTKAVYLVRHAAANDWEDMAYGPGPDGKGNFLYMGDIGDNNRVRTDATIYRIAEPKLGSLVGTKAAPILTDEPTIRRTFAYPDGAHNAEALLCHPQTGVLYIVTKEESGAAGVYKFPVEPKSWWEKNLLTRVGTVTIENEQHPFPNLVTGGDIAPDGKKVILRTYDAAYELRLPDSAKEFDDIWKQKLTRVPAATMPQAEAIAYTADGKALLDTSEKAPAPLYELKLRQEAR